MAIDIETVLTDVSLEGYAGGAQALQTLLPEEWLEQPDETKKVARVAKEQVLKIVMRRLARRSPPVTEADITADPTQLEVVIAYGTMELLCRAAATSEGSPNLKRADAWLKKFDAELEALNPPVDDDGDGEPDDPGSSLSISFERG